MSPLRQSAPQRSPSTPTPRVHGGSRSWSRSREDTLGALRLAGPSTLEQLSERTGLHVNTLRDHLGVLVAAGTVEVGTLARTGRGRPPKVYTAIGEAPATDAEDALPAVRAAVMELILGGYGRSDRDLESDAIEDGRRLARSLGLSDSAGTSTRSGVNAGVPPTSTASDIGRLNPDGGTPRAPVDPRTPDAGQEAQLRALSSALTRIGFRPAPVRRVKATRGVPPRPSRTGSRPMTAGLDIDLCHCPFRDLAIQRPEVVCAMHLGLAREVTESVGGPLRPDSLSPFVGPRTCTLHLSR